MDAQSIFTTASIMVLANGAILAAICRELPATLRPAAAQWCLGTLLIALGCIVFAFGTPLPRPIMLGAANAAFAFGLTAYHVAIRHFLRLEVKAWHFLPAMLATLSVLWFSTVTQSFHIRMAVVSIAWTWLMAICVNDLRGVSRGNASLARTVLTALFALVGLYSVARGVFYLTSGVPDDFAVEAGGHSLNVLSALLMTLLPVMGTTAFLLMCSDRLRRGLERAATTDYLTGLPNRRSLAQAAAAAFPAVGGSGLALTVFDLDRFKVINDTYGHDAGDRALVHVANHLLRALEPGNMIARTGGEEFVLLLRDPSPADAIRAAEGMRAAIEASDFRIDGIRVSLTVSAGLAFYAAEDRTYDEVLSRADRALYLAKAAGRNRLEIAPPDTPAQERRTVVAVPPLSSGLEDTAASETQISAV